MYIILDCEGVRILKHILNVLQVGSMWRNVKRVELVDRFFKKTLKLCGIILYGKRCVKKMIVL